MGPLKFMVSLIVTAWCQSPAQAQYQYPHDDIVVAMAGGLFNLIDHLSGSSYDGYYHNNGSVCTTPQLTGGLSHFGDSRKSHYDLTSGTVKTTVALSVVAEIRAAQCTFHTIDVSAGCLSGPIPLVGPPGAEFFNILVCALNVDNFFQVALPVPVKSLIRSQSQNNTWSIFLLSQQRRTFPFNCRSRNGTARNGARCRHHLIIGRFGRFPRI